MAEPSYRKWKIESVLEDVRISLIQSLELDGYGNNYSIVNGVLEIKGWEHIKRVLQLCKRQIYYYNSELKENWEKLISHIMHELLLVGMPFEAIVHVPKLKREPNSNIINESYFVGPTIQFNKRSEDYFTPIINYTIELSNGKICGFDPVGVHYLEYLVYGNNIYIDDAVVNKLGIKSGDIINIRLFIFPRNLYPIFIYSKVTSTSLVIKF